MRIICVFRWEIPRIINLILNRRLELEQILRRLNVNLFFLSHKCNHIYGLCTNHYTQLHDSNHNEFNVVRTVPKATFRTIGQCCVIEVIRRFFYCALNDATKSMDCTNADHISLISCPFLYVQGCAKALYDSMKQQIRVFAIVLVVFAVLQLAAIFASCFLSQKLYQRQLMLA